jgi:hypothetical protein
VRIGRQKRTFVMSMRSRARALQRVTGLTFQQAQARIRELGAAPAELKRKTGWTLERCDEVLVSASLHAEITRALPTGRPRSIFQAACDLLLTRTEAIAVIWIGRDGSRAFAGQPTFLHLAGSIATMAVRQGVDHLAAVFADARRAPHVEPVGRHGALVVIPGERTKVGPLRLAARAHAERLEHDLETYDWIPPRGRTPPSGAPAHDIAGFAWPTWTPPRTRVDN